MRNLLGLVVATVLSSSACAGGPRPVRFRIESFGSTAPAAGAYSSYRLLPNAARPAGLVRVGLAESAPKLDIAVARPGQPVKATRYDLREGSPIPQASLEGMTLVGTEEVDVAAGRFVTRHYRCADGDTVIDVWVSDEVQPLGLVKRVETRRGQPPLATVELADHAPATMQAARTTSPAVVAAR